MIPLIFGIILIFDFVLQQWRDSEKKSRHLIKIDPLTGLYNRRYLNKYLHKLSIKNDYLSIALLDIDYFKRINDECGHLVGDRVLKEVATTLRESMRMGDWLGRFGGEEFIIIMPNIDMDNAVNACERCRIALSGIEVTSIKGETWSLSASFGLVHLKAPFDISQALSTVDQLMYQAKQHGRNRVVFRELDSSHRFEKAFHAASVEPSGDE